MRKLVISAGALAFVLFVLGCLTAAFQTSRQPQRSLLAPVGVIDLGKMVIGDNAVVSITITNPDRLRAAQIIGAQQGCSPNGCLYWDRLPVTIPANSAIELTGVFTPNRLSAYQAEFALYTDVPGQMFLTVGITGFGVQDQPPPTETVQHE